MQQVAGDLAAAIKRARNHDQAAFAELYRQAVTPVYRYLSARLNTIEEAEELTQEVFLAALTGIRGLRATDEAALMAWLFQIARHKLADHLRRRYRRPTTSLDNAAHLQSGSARPDELAEGVEAREAVREVMEQLTPEQREVVICKYVLEYDNERTAQHVGKNTNAVNHCTTAH